MADNFGTCDICRKRAPLGFDTRVERWICDECHTAKCGRVLLSGMTCDLPPAHGGDHFNRFGLRDPRPELAPEGNKNA